MCLAPKSPKGDLKKSVETERRANKNYSLSALFLFGIPTNNRT
jgi:hypothetical protein